MRLQSHPLCFLYWINIECVTFNFMMTTSNTLSTYLGRECTFLCFYKIKKKILSLLQESILLIDNLNVFHGATICIAKEIVD